MVGLGGLGLIMINKTDYFIYALLTAVILMCESISKRSWVVSQKVDKVICWGTGISYAVYLVHMPILEICQKYLEFSIAYKSMVAVLVTFASAWILTLIDRKIFRKIELHFMRTL